MMDLLSRFSDDVGIVGVILTLLAYYLLNIDKLRADSMTYLMLNLVGSCFLLFSLLFHWNLASVCIEVAWITISLIGIYRYLKAKSVKIEKPNNLFVIYPNNAG